VVFSHFSQKQGEVGHPAIVEVRGTHPFAKIAKGWGTLNLFYEWKGGPPAEKWDHEIHW